MATTSYPTADREAFILWCRSHAGIFSERSAEIGLAPEQAAAFAAETAAAEAARAEQVQLLNAYRAATEAAERRAADLLRRASECVRTIRLYARLQEGEGGESAVLTAAQLPAPKTRARRGPEPEAPGMPDVELDPLGRVVLSWKYRNQRGTSGTTFIVRRRFRRAAGAGGGMTEWEMLGIAGKKKFVDETLPVSLGGAAAVQYTVQAVRGGREGPVSQIRTVGIGSVSAGERGAMKMAA